METAARMEFV